VLYTQQSRNTWQRLAQFPYQTRLQPGMLAGLDYCSPAPIGLPEVWEAMVWRLRNHIRKKPCGQNRPTNPKRSPKEGESYTILPAQIFIVLLLNNILFDACCRSPSFQRLWRSSEDIEHVATFSRPTAKDHASVTMKPAFTHELPEIVHIVENCAGLWNSESSPVHVQVVRW